MLYSNICNMLFNMKIWYIAYDLYIMLYSNIFNIIIYKYNMLYSILPI